MVFSDLVPRAAIVLLLALGAAFTFFESVYLQDQAIEIGKNASKIVLWMWVFRLIAIAFTTFAVMILIYTLRRYMNPG